jgi:hypothetical protein
MKTNLIITVIITILVTMFYDYYRYTNKLNATLLRLNNIQSEIVKASAACAAVGESEVYFVINAKKGTAIGGTCGDDALHTAPIRRKER